MDKEKHEGACWKLNKWEMKADIMGWWEAGFCLSAAKVFSTRLLGLSQRHWLLLCWCTGSTNAITPLPSKTKVSREKTGGEKAACLCHCQEVFLRRESPTEIFLWLDLRPVSVPIGVIGGDFASLGTYHEHTFFMRCKSYQTLLIWQGKVVMWSQSTATSAQKDVQP